MRKITNESRYKKKCASCDNEMHYSNIYALQNGINNNTKCPSCRAIGHSMNVEARKNISLKNSGEKNGMFGTGERQITSLNPNYGNPKGYSHSPEARKKITIAKTGKPNPSFRGERNPSKKLENRIRLSLIKRGDKNIWFGKKPWNYKIGSNHLSEYRQYERVVLNTTKKNIPMIPNFDKRKRGRAGVPGAHHVDHIVSMRKGFRENINPHLIGSLSNLQFIPWEENSDRRELYRKIKTK